MNDELFDEWGHCKICGGDSPNKHEDNCAIHKIEMADQGEASALKFYKLWEAAVAERDVSHAENARLTALVTELSSDWSTPEKILEHKKLVGEVARLAEKLAEVEGRCAGLAKERDEVTAAFQKECDHEWQHEDDSFDHEFGTEQLHSSVCEKCGLSKPEPETFGDEAI